MKKGTFLAVILLFIASFGMKAQTYDLLMLPDAEFQVGGNSIWSFERYTYSTGVYSTLNLYDDSGRVNFRDNANPERYQGVLIGQPDATNSAIYGSRIFSWHDNKNEHLYVASNYEVYSLLVANPAIVFTVPTDGYYKVNTTVLREDGWFTTPLKAQFRYRYNGEIVEYNSSTIGFDYTFGAGGLNTDPTLLNEIGTKLSWIKQQPASQTFYIKATAGSKITFEVNCQDYASTASSIVREAWARTKWQALNLTVVTAAEATAAAKYCDPYSTGYSDVFTAKINEASDMLINSFVGTDVGEYPQLAYTIFEEAIATALGSLNAGSVNALNVSHFISILDQAAATFKSKVNIFDWSQSYNYKLYPIDTNDPNAISNYNTIFTGNTATPWDFQKYTVATGVYTNFTKCDYSSKAGKSKKAWYNSANEWLFIDSTAWVHPLTTASPAIRFTAPADGIYKVGCSINRNPASSVGTTMYARCRFLPVGTTTVPKESFVMARGYGKFPNSGDIKDFDWYIKLIEGDIITFEEDAYTANNISAANSQWSRLYVCALQGTTSSIEAKIASDTLTYVNPYKPGDFTALKTLIASCNSFLATAPIDSVIGKYPLSAKTIFQAAIDNSQALVDANAAGQTFVDTEAITLTSALTAFKNKLVLATNTLMDGLYYVKITDGAGGYKYLTDWSLIQNASDVVTSFPIFLAKDDVHSKIQQWKFSKDATVSRFRIDSKARIDTTGFSTTYINENAQFSTHTYSNVWNSLNVYFDGNAYSIQRAGNAGSSYFYPGTFTSSTTTETRILVDGTSAKTNYLQFYLEPVQTPATDVEKLSLDTVIVNAQALYNVTTEGTTFGSFATADRITFNTTISSAIAISTVVNTSGNDITAAKVNLNAAIQAYKNAQIKTTNAITANGYYFIKVSDGANGFLYLTDNNQVMPVLGGTTVFPVFLAKDIVNVDQQLFKFNIDTTNQRVKIDSKVRLSSTTTFTTTYLAEGGQFGYNVYAPAWNTFNVYSDGTKYAFQRAGSAGNTFWYPGAYTTPDASTGTRILTNGVGTPYDFFNFYLELAFADAVSSVSNSNIVVFGMQNGLKVCNAKMNDVIEVYNTMGSLVKKTIVTRNMENVNLQSGLYIVRVSNEQEHAINKVFVK